MQTFKWKEYLSWQRKLLEAKASEAALKESLVELSLDKKLPQSKLKAIFRRSRLEEVEVVQNNIYDEGFLHNLYEIIFPYSTRKSFSQKKSKLR